MGAIQKYEYRREKLTREMKQKENIILESDRTVVLKDKYPKAMYHFLVLTKEQIKDVTELTRDHLDLLDHMMEMANKVIERQDEIQSSHFLIGFKMEPFMSRLNMHVISNDFFSLSLRRVRHWNIFNTDLFLSYRAAYAMLRVKGSIEPLPHDKVEQLWQALPLKCNQCDFTSDTLVQLKGHLGYHWQQRQNKLHINKVLKMMDEVKLDDAPTTTTLKAEDLVSEIDKSNAIMPNDQITTKPKNFNQKIKINQNAGQNEQQNQAPFRQQSGSSKNFQMQGAVPKQQQFQKNHRHIPNGKQFEPNQPHVPTHFNPFKQTPQYEYHLNSEFNPFPQHSAQINAATPIGNPPTGFRPFRQYMALKGSDSTAPNGNPNAFKGGANWKPPNQYKKGPPGPNQRQFNNQQEQQQQAHQNTAGSQNGKPFIKKQWQPKQPYKQNQAKGSPSSHGNKQENSPPDGNHQGQSSTHGPSSMNFNTKK